MIINHCGCNNAMVHILTAGLYITVVPLHTMGVVSQVTPGGFLVTSAAVRVTAEVSSVRYSSVREHGVCGTGMAHGR